jgi:hypothetical protein
MLTHEQIVALARRHDGLKTLSAYISVPADASSPVTAARALLRQGIARVRDDLAYASHVERTVFESCAARLSARVEQGVHKQGGGTWVGFASADGATYDESLHAATPVIVTWEERMRIVPYLAACDDRSALVVMLDREHATLYRYGLDVLSEIERIETIPDISTGPHMGAPPRRAFHSGTQGETSTETAARQVAAAFKRHASHVLSRITECNRADEWLVLGGAAEAVAHVASLLPCEARARMAIASTATGMSVAQVRDAAEAATRGLRCARHRRLVKELLERTHGVALDAIGYEQVDCAITRRAIGMLVMARRWTEDHDDTAENIVRLALAQHAAVEIVNGEAAVPLEMHSNGIGARLRFAISASPGAVHSESAMA